MNPEAIYAIEPPCLMEFAKAATANVVGFRCRSCGREETFTFPPDLGPSVGDPLAFRGYTYLDAKRLLPTMQSWGPDDAE